MKLEPLKLSKQSSNYFGKLCREIIGQQLAPKAARTIVGRFDDLFTQKAINPEQILNLSDQKLRDVGMSWAKVSYIKDLAQKTKDREVRLNNLHKLENDLVIAELVKVKGIGPWTAEMFLIFNLGREDIFSHGDLGLNRAMRQLYGFNNKPNEKQVNKIISKWSPYKSYGCLALWESVDG